uniref:Alpha-carbonic anhydrase domain-containing protein n=1 Tax=Homalodisca liturata TaxID=320908 RepID=A0A1B6H913_9HEMI
MHWGMRDVLGSEHKVNGRSYAIEGHCVHFNTKYGSYKEASKYHDGLAVVAFFGEAGKVDNPKIERLVKRLGYVKHPNSSVSMSAWESLSWFADLGEPTNYFTYPGSLTTFPYSENVIWIVYPRPLLISFRQVKAFRKLLSSDCIANTENTRPLQKFNCRPLIYAIGT